MQIFTNQPANTEIDQIWHGIIYQHYGINYCQYNTWRMVSWFALGLYYILVQLRKEYNRVWCMALYKFTVCNVRLIKDLWDTVSLTLSTSEGQCTLVPADYARLWTLDGASGQAIKRRAFTVKGKCTQKQNSNHSQYKKSRTDYWITIY